MSFDKLDALMVGGIFLTLKDDKDTAAAVFLGEPEAKPSEYKGQEKTQAVFPVLTEEGLKVWPVSARTYRAIRSRWASIKGRAVIITRHGKAKSPETYYTMDISDAHKAMEKDAKAIKPAAVADLLKEGVRVREPVKGKPKVRKPKL